MKGGEFLDQLLKKGSAPIELLNDCSVTEIRINWFQSQLCRVTERQSSATSTSVPHVCRRTVSCHAATQAAPSHLHAQWAHAAKHAYTSARLVIYLRGQHRMTSHLRNSSLSGTRNFVWRRRQKTGCSHVYSNSRHSLGKAPTGRIRIITFSSLYFIQNVYGEDWKMEKASSAIREKPTSQSADGCKK
jgi:hypothetical protein